MRGVNFKVLDTSQGGRPAAQKIFEDLVVDIVCVLHPDARSIEANPGDWGIDVIVGSLQGDVHVWQAKYFIDGVGESQKSQIREAYRQVVKRAREQQFTLVSWTLCIPVAMDPAAARWWDRWMSRQVDGVRIGLWQENHLRRMLLSEQHRDVYKAYFESDPAKARAAREHPYRALIGQMAPDTLVGRDEDLERLARFATGPPGYRWLVGGPWTGKTALLATFATDPPHNVDIVAYFLTRRRGDADSSRFLQAANDQLSHYLRADPPARLDDPYVFAALWGRAVARAASIDRQLVLVIDGLDEDTGPAVGQASVAQLLPFDLGDRGHVLVSSRMYPLLPTDVAVEHPLRAVPQMGLPPSDVASELELRARQDLQHVLDPRASGIVAHDVLAILAAAAGPLALDDLVALVSIAGEQRVRRPQVTRALEREVARVLEPIGGDGQVRFTFAHDSLHMLALDAFGDAELERLLEVLQAWENTTSESGWGDRAPAYLFDSYPRLMRQRSPEALHRLYGRIDYVEAAIKRLGVGRVRADLHASAGSHTTPFLQTLRAIVDREGNNLRQLPEDDPQYFARRVALRAFEYGATDVAESALREIRRGASPQLVPRWTATRTNTAVSEVLTGHDHGVADVAVGRDGRFAASAGGFDESVRIWDLETGREIAMRMDHGAPVGSVAVASSAGIVASGGFDNCIRLWDVETGEAIAVLREAEALSEWDQPMVDKLAITDDGTVITSARSREVVVWDVASRTRRWVLAGHEGHVTNVAISHHGKRVVSAGSDATVRLWDADSGTGLFVLRGHRARVNDVAIKDDLVVSAGGDRTVRIWDLTQQRVANVLRGHRGPVEAIALAEESMTLASVSADQTMRVWDVATGRCLRTFEFDEVDAGDLDFDPEDPRVAVSADGRRLLSSDGGQQITVWDLSRAGGNVSAHAADVLAVALEHDPHVAISGGADSTVKAWDADTGRCIRTLRAHRKPISSVAVDAAGTRAMSVDWGNTMVLWDLVTGHATTFEIPAGEGPLHVSMTPHGTVGVCADRTGRVWAWDVRKGSRIGPLAFADDEINAVALSADATRCVAVSHKGRMHVWNVRGGRRTAVIDVSNAPLHAVALSRDGRLAVTGSNDATIGVWDLSDSRRMRELTGHDGWVTDLALDADALRLVSSSTDCTLRLWDLSRGLCMLVARHPEPCVLAASTDQRGDLAIFAGDSTSVAMYDLVAAAPGRPGRM